MLTTIKVTIFYTPNNLGLNQATQQRNRTVNSMTDTIKQSLDEGDVMGAVLIDLKKPFDTVNHEILLNNK